MSHQVVAETCLDDATLVREAFEALNWKYTENEDGTIFNVIGLSDGSFGVDTKTGKVNHGYDNRGSVGDLIMKYQLANVTRQAAVEGQTILQAETKVEANGKRRRYLEITVVK